MIYLLIPLSLVIGLLTGYFISKKVTTKNIYNKLKVGTGRMGIIRVHDSWANACGIIEVEELEVANEMTKVIIHDVIPDRASQVKSKDELLRKWGGNDWVKTTHITWYDNNTQKIREHKLEEILGNES